MKGRGDPQDKDGMEVGGGAALYHTHTDRLLHETLLHVLNIHTHSKYTDYNIKCAFLI